MKIAFLSETLEPGRSGVGDYSWRLGAALQARGHTVKVVGFADRHLEAREEGVRHVTCEEISYSRLPLTISSNLRWRMLIDLLEAWKPDWTSLQFVPFSFHSKGMVKRSRFPFSGRFGGAHHLMMHETWIGQHPGAKILDRLLGLMQRRDCLTAIREWNPQSMHTSCSIYAEQLGKQGCHAEILPMFGTIDPKNQTEPDVQKKLQEQLYEKTQMAAERLRLVGIFGTIHCASELAGALTKLYREGERHGLSVAACFLGSATSKSQQVMQLVRNRGADMLLVTFEDSFQTGLAAVMREMDMGLVTTPIDCVGKSSAAASLRDQGLPVLTCSLGAYGGVTIPPFFHVDDFLRGGLIQLPPRYTRRDRALDAATQIEAAFRIKGKYNAISEAYAAGTDAISS